MDTFAVVLGVVGIGAMWDAARRYIEARRFNQAALDEIREVRSELKEHHAQIQAVMGKLNASIATTANRTRSLSRPS